MGSPKAQANGKPSPAPSNSSTSLQSADGNFQLPPAHGGPVAPPKTNGTPADSRASSNAPPAKRHTMSSRIGSMFGRADSSHNVKSPPEEVTSNGASPRSMPATPSQHPEKKSMVERTKSTLGSTSDKKKEANTNATTSRRFWLTEDGSHEHHLRSMKRQEKLSHMLKDFMPGRKKDGNDDQPLSLMANWVDQMRSDRDRMANIEKGGPQSTMTLVQKYGKCQEVVGRGAFGIVRVAHKTDSKDPKREQLFAVKEFRQRPGESDRKYQKRLTAEFCISSSMKHPNVIQTLDLLKDDKGDFCEVMEYCAGGDLYSLILASSQLEVVEADCYFKQLMRGVEYMHEMGVAHRDLKPENLLLTQHGSIKITDFGNGECFRMAWEQEAHMTAGLCGSAPYIAPEEYVDEEFDPRAVDVWACGVIYMAMRTGRHLWRVAQKEEDEFYTKYLEDRKQEEGYRPIEVLRRQKCRNVIYSILDPNPMRRLTAHQVLISEWVNDIKVCTAGNEGF